MCFPKLKCCGVDSYKDWANVTLADGGEVPASCCMEQQNVEQCEKSPDQFLDGMDGCFTLLKDTLEKNKSSIGIGTASIVVFMVIYILICLENGLNVINILSEFTPLNHSFFFIFSLQIFSQFSCTLLVYKTEETIRLSPE